MSIATSIEQLRNLSQRKSEKQTQHEAVINISKTIELLELEIAHLATAVHEVQINNKTDDVPILVNQLIFFRIAFKDILTAAKQFISATNETDRNFLTRALALHIYEVVDDSKEFFNKKMRSELQRLPNKDLLLEDFFRIQEFFKAFKNNSFKELQDIRHNTAAHKELNSVLLHQKIQNIDVKRVHTFSIFALILFVCVLAFQKNVCEMLMQSVGGSLDMTYGPKKWNKVESCFKCTLWQVIGMKPWLAEMLCEKTNQDLHLYKAIITAMGDAAAKIGDMKMVDSVNKINSQLQLI